MSSERRQVSLRRGVRTSLRLTAWAAILAAGTAVAFRLPQKSAQTRQEPAELRPVPANLEGLWRFRTDPDDAGERLGWQRPDFRDDDWRQLRVPGGWEAQGITDPRPGMPPKPRDGLPWTDYDGVAWYRRTVRIPASWRAKTLLLQLGSVDDADRTFFNGTLVGQTPLSRPRAVLVQRLYRVPASLVRPGAENVIAIKVTDGGGPGGLMGPILSLIPEDVLHQQSRLPGDDRPLAQRFADPPAASRILKIIHNWPDDPASQDLLIRTLIAQGFGGVVCNVSFNQYLQSEAHWQAFLRAVKEAKKAGMSLWLYDEKGYPSGTAGGLTLQGHPEWEARGLLIADAVTSGEPVTLKVPPGRIILAAGYPITEVGLDPSRAVAIPVDRIGEDRSLTWTPPPVPEPAEGTGRRWQVLVITEDRIYEGTHAANSLGDKLPYINLLLPEPTARFLQLTHDAYAARLGSDLGRHFVSTFTDEPSLMSLYLGKMPYRVLPWSQNLADEFRKRRGRDLMPLLPLLAAGDGPQARKARYDFWKTVAELVADNYFGQIQRWCDRHHILSGGHLLLEEDLSHHVPLYGDFFACVRRLTAPSIDCLTSIPSEVPWHIARIIGSIADLEGRTVTMCETSDHVQVYRPKGDTRPVRVVSEEEIRGTCNRLLLGGITTITSYYSFRDLSTEQLQRLNAYVGRCATMLTGGHQVADIAVLYPVESAWIGFLPSRHWTHESPHTALVASCFYNVSQTLYAARRDFTYLDTKAILDARVENGALVHGPLRWRVVILPHADTLPMAAWEKLERFVESGGILIAVGALPQNSEAEFPSSRVQAIARRLFGEGSGLRITPVGTGRTVRIPEGAEPLLGGILDRLLEHDVAVSDPKAPIRITHRRIAGREIFFLINDSAEPWSGTVSVCATGAGELWDPITGMRKALASPQGIAVSLQPYTGVFLRFGAPKVPQRLGETGHALPALERRPLPPSSVAPGAGEHVQAAITPSDDRWQVTGTLKRSDVDTFLFAMCRYEPALDLSGETALSVRIETPSGQPFAPRLLVILTDRRGVQYWTDTGRSLALPGSAELLLPLSRFSHAPFSQGPAGPFDWKAVTGISIGWGGHYGRQGDRIEFLLHPPESVRLSAAP